MSPHSYAVGAPVLLNTYWHIHVAELILDGAEPRGQRSGLEELLLRHLDGLRP